MANYLISSNLNTQQTATSSNIDDASNPRKRQRTACDRCKSRKQRCDNAYPQCTNCAKAGKDCNKPPETEALNGSYTRALEDQVAYLEQRLMAMEEQQTRASSASTTNNLPSPAHANCPLTPNVLANDAANTQEVASPFRHEVNVADVVGLLSLGNGNAEYVGSSSGFALATDLGRMVQATVWNKALWLPTPSGSESERRSSNSDPLPLSISDNDRMQGHDINHSPDTPTPGQEAYPPSNLSQFILLSQLRTFEARIQRTIYRVDRTTSALQPKMHRLISELDAWRQIIPPSLQPSEHERLMLHFHRDVRLLLQPFLSILEPSSELFRRCVDAAGQVCQIHKRLHQTPEYGHSFVAVHTVFVSGITLLYALWKGSNWSFSISNDIRAASCVLAIMGERAPWIRRFRDEFDALTEATMAALQNANCETSAEERLETAVPAPDFTTFDGLGMTDAAALEMQHQDMPTLKEILALEQVEPNRFQGKSNPPRMGNVLPIAFGGYTIGVATQAACFDIPPNFRLYAINGNFLGPAYTDRPVVVKTKVYRTTKTFTTKLVEVLQKQDDGKERVCLVALADFHVVEPESFMVYSAPPSMKYSSVEESWTPADRKKTMVKEKILTQAEVDTHDKIFSLMSDLIDMRFTPQSIHGQTLQGFAKGYKTTQEHLPLTERSSSDWLRVREKVTTHSENVTDLAFLLDASISFTPLVLQSMPLTESGACSTLDFSLRFLTPEINANDFHLREWKTYAGDAARTFSEARLWDSKGKMVASMTQTCILRPPPRR
ncbi:acyl-CoA thioesterase II, partial [Aureobasidium melanogenum]